jgi:hypothetical protein
MSEITITIQKKIEANGLTIYHWPKRGDLMTNGIVIKSKYLSIGQNETTIKPLSKNKVIRKLQIYWYRHF